MVHAEFGEETTGGTTRREFDNVLRGGVDIEGVSLRMSTPYCWSESNAAPLIAGALFAAKPKRKQRKTSVNAVNFTQHASQLLFLLGAKPLKAGEHYWLQA